MKAIILAAGYATRLYPLTENFPKPLLEVGGQTILDHLVDQLEAIPDIDRCHLITNHRFHTHFTDWAQDRTSRLPLDILDDGTTSNDDRLGAVGDIQFAIDACRIADDILVLAADNILQFSLRDFVETCKTRPAPSVCIRRIEDPQDRKRRGIAVIDEQNRIIDFEEKPAQPKSEWGVPPFYIYPRASLPRIKAYLDNGGTADAPGHFLVYLHKVETVYAYKITGEILDIGNHESLAEARAFFKNRQKRSP